MHLYESSSPMSVLMLFLLSFVLAIIGVVETYDGNNERALLFVVLSSLTALHGSVGEILSHIRKAETQSPTVTPPGRRN